MHGRPDPPYAADERTMLCAFLDFQRATLEWKTSGLGAAELRRRAVPTSNLTLLGLVRHMAEVERSWWRTGFAGEDVGYIWCRDEDADASFAVADADVDGAFAAWRDEVERSRAIVASASLDDTLRQPGTDQITLRWLLCHMVEEYARHNGHADLLREAIDGEVGE